MLVLMVIFIGTEVCYLDFILQWMMQEGKGRQKLP